MQVDNAMAQYTQRKTNKKCQNEIPLAERLRTKTAIKFLLEGMQVQPRIYSQRII